MWHLDKCRPRRACAAPLLSLETPHYVKLVALHSNIQAISKGSDQTARMRRLI